MLHVLLGLPYCCLSLPALLTALLPAHLSIPLPVPLWAGTTARWPDLHQRPVLAVVVAAAVAVVLPLLPLFTFHLDP